MLRKMDLGLTDKVIMVGGASKGLGYAVARALAAEGAAVAIASRDEAAVQAAAIETWYAATERTFGGVDGVFCNTGGPPAGAAMAFDDAAWQQAFDLLLLSVVRTVRLAAPSMAARGGGAVLVGTSSSVKEPIPHLALSNVLRAGVTSLAKT